MDETPNQPVKKISVGAIQAAVWENESKQEGSTSFFSVQLSRSYKDKEDKWRNTNSIPVRDIPKAQLALAQAYEYVMLEKRGTTDRKEAS